MNIESKYNCLIRWIYDCKKQIKIKKEAEQESEMENIETKISTTDCVNTLGIDILNCNESKKYD